MKAGGDLKWLTLGEASEYLGVAPATTRKWSDQGRLPVFYTPGGHRRFQREALDEFSGGGRTEIPQVVPLVLVIADDAEPSRTIRGRLEELGYDVRVSRSATVSPSALEGPAPGLVLLEVGMLGTEASQLLRRIEDGCGSVPVIMFDSRKGGDPTTERADIERLVAKATRTLPI
jgi:excisionase family DNA binding protein